MFKTTVTYKDFNNEEHTEDIYFHMLTPEIADLQFNPMFDSDLGTYIRQAMASDERAKIYTFFKLMIVNSYGRRSADGSEFIKKEEYTEKFLNSRAYEEFFIRLMMDANFAASFWNGIMPEALSKQLELLGESSGSKKKITEMSKEELLAMVQEKLASKAPANEVTA